jgi:cytochrome c6
MKIKNTFVFAFAVAMAVSLAFPAHAQDAGATYKSKCALCHGVDGAKVTGHDLAGPAVQKESDADLNSVITDGKPPRMPKFGDKLKPEEIKGLVAYLRTLKK